MVKIQVRSQRRSLKLVPGKICRDSIHFILSVYLARGASVGSSFGAGGQTGYRNQGEGEKVKKLTS
jgi:hypothetical protein